MAHVDLKRLVSRLNKTTRDALEAAVGLCVARTNYHVEVEHWLLKLLEGTNTDIVVLLRQEGVDLSRLTIDLTQAIDGFRTGSSRQPALSPDVVRLIREAWLMASINDDSPLARTAHVLLALVSDDALGRIAAGASREFASISPETIQSRLAGVLPKTDEAAEVPAAGPSSGRPTGVSGPTPSLDQFTIDLTERARKGQIDPVLGRDPELRQIADILMRRRQNNPILTGEAGVGKTAVVEGFALRVVAGEVPPSLLNVSVRTLDMGLLQAGAGVKGEFENRLKSVIKEVTASPRPIILFIDEAHTLIGAGGGQGQSDAANLLKPALARGELRTIAATTWAEYKRYFEKDAALARRFQVVKVEEPDEQRAVEMLRGLVATLEQHHQVRILSDALVDAVKLSSRYISGRQLPDKALSVLDTTCARIGLSRSATPPAIEDARRQLEQIDVQSGILRREAKLGMDHSEALATLTEDRVQVAQALAVLEERWTQERELVETILTLRGRITGSEPEVAVADDGGAALEELKGHEAALRALQGETALVHPEVNSQAISETVAAWTGIPVGRMMADQVTTVLNLQTLMERQIVGQSHALDRIAQSIRTSRANLTDPRTPIGVFLLAGTSGVGKTETAMVLADLLYGGTQNMTVINMSEFKEEHKVSLLMGSPPGYVGYGEGGVLTEAVRRKPYSVVLLDEMEKCHPGVQDIFYQVFDKGILRDSEGRDIDFKNTLIIMTTNAGTDLIKNLCRDPDTAPDPEPFVKALFPELLKTFKPAFLGRVTIIPYYPLSDAIMRQIVVLKLGKIGRRVQEHYKATFSYSPEVVDAIARRCTEVDTGARNVDHILTRSMLPELSAAFLARMAERQTIRGVSVTLADDETFRYEIV